MPFTVKVPYLIYYPAHDGKIKVLQELEISDVQTFCFDENKLC